VKIDVHSVRYPNVAPAIENVTMQEGSSLAAPVITPGPHRLKADAMPGVPAVLSSGVAATN